jgi:hypothetical protein
MRERAWLVAFLVAQRLVELCFAQFNAAVACKGRRRIRRRPLPADDRAARLVAARLVVARPRSFCHSVLAGDLCTASGWSVVGDRESWTTLDNARHCVARLRSGFARTISLAQASELSDRCARNCGGSAGARLAAICFDFFSRQCCAACLPNPHRKRGAGYVDHILRAPNLRICWSSSDQVPTEY